MSTTPSQTLPEALDEIRRLREDLAGREIGEPQCRELLDALRRVEASLGALLKRRDAASGHELLATVAVKLAHAVDMQEVLEAILEDLKRVVPYAAGGIFLLSDGGKNLQAQTMRGYPLEGLEHIRQKVDEGIIGWVIANGRPAVVDDVLLDDRYVMIRPETRSEVAVPILAGGEVIGAINLEADGVGVYGGEDLPLLEDLAAQAALAIERARTHQQLVTARQIERELQIARRIQVYLLPRREPEIPGYDASGLNVPSLEVGGDYYDFIRITRDDLGIVIADVAGKGVPAGLIMSGLRGALRTRVETTFSIRSVIEGVNRFLHQSTRAERFVTAFYGVLNLPSGRLTYVNAGHNPPLLLHADGRAVCLRAGGPLLGVLPEAEYEQAIADLEPGALLCLFTDGIVEAGGGEGEEFGEQRLEELIRAHAGESAADIARVIDREATLWSQGRGEPDDRTVIVVKRT